MEQDRKPPAVPGTPQRFRRTAAWYGAGLLALIAMLAACGPFSDDDDGTATLGPARPVGGGQNTPVMSTFTATIPGTTPEVVETAAARNTAQAATATYEAANPQPTSTSPEGLPTVPGGVGLTPPKAILTDGVGSIDSTEGSYSWVYDDAEQSYARIDAPLMPITEVALTTAGGPFTMTIPEVSEQANNVQIGAYTFDDNTAIPTDQTGQPGDELMFSPRFDPVAEATLASLDESFTLELAPGHYLFQARVTWPDYVHRPPNSAEMTFPIYITYLFNVIIE